MIQSLQKSVTLNNKDEFKKYLEVTDELNKKCTIRGHLTFQESTPIPLEWVEQSKDIVKRFCTGAMSIGSISKETHEVIASSMNIIGGKSIGALVIKGKVIIGMKYSSDNADSYYGLQVLWRPLCL